jgi:hypothetical protein
MFLLGYFLARLRRRLDLWSHVAYVLTCGWLPFTFFRDAFSISLIKNILEFSLLLPAAIIAISRFVTWAVGGRHLFSPEGSNGAEPASDEDLPKF